MRNTVIIKYDEEGMLHISNTDSSENDENVKEMNAAAIRDVPIEKWNTPFVRDGVRWFGLYEEIKEIYGYDSFSIIFYADDEQVLKLRTLLTAKGIIVLGSQNHVEIFYDDKRFNTKISVNGRSINTSKVNGYPIQQVVNPIHTVNWRGLFEEVRDYLGTAPFYVTFYGNKEGMNILISLCPDGVDLSYGGNTSSESVETLLGNTVSSLSNVCKTIFQENGAPPTNGAYDEVTPFETQNVKKSSEFKHTMKSEHHESDAATAPQVQELSMSTTMNDNQSTIIKNMYCPFCKHNDAFVISMVSEQSSKIRLFNIGLRYLLCLYFTFGIYAIVCGLPIVEKNRFYERMIYGFCPRCGKSYSAAAPQKIKMKGKEDKKFHRNLDKKVIAGVCAGIADYTNIPVWWVRLRLVLQVLTWFINIYISIQSIVGGTIADILS